jgi:HopA1 effector protein family
MPDPIRSIRQIVGEVVFHSSTSFSCNGRRCVRLAPRVKRAMTEKTARHYLRYQLQSHLYGDFYIRGGAKSAQWGSRQSPADSVSFVGALSAANTGTGCRENGWEVISSSADETAVRKDGLTVIVRPDACIRPDSATLQPGLPVCLSLPRERKNLSPGYYMALSNQGDMSSDALPLVRFYCNLKKECAALFISHFTSLLNDSDIFFRLKVLNNPSAYSRCDAGVLYFCKADYPKIYAIVYDVYRKIVSCLKPEIPVFTKFIAPGIGLAEDPGGQESFGQHRCGILADALISSYERGVRTLDGELEIIKEHFAAKGIHLGMPYLNPGSADIYSFHRLVAG